MEDGSGLGEVIVGDFLSAGFSGSGLGEVILSYFSHRNKKKVINEKVLHGFPLENRVT